jgi:Uma2 family endonuclease
MTVPATAQELMLYPDMAGALMTPEEFDLAEADPDDGCRYELIHGVLVVTPIPADAEVGPNELLGHFLLLYRENNPQGRVLDLTLPERHVHFPDSRRRPDRVIWAGLGRRPDTRNDPPTIVVEFVSAGRRSWRRDYIEKRREYESVGVQEYWIIDRFLRTLTVYGKLASPTGERVVAENEIYVTPLLPGFELPLARLLEAADSLK